MAQTERRDKPRVAFDTRIILETGTTEIQTEGNSRNLSLNGIYVKSREKIEIDSPCRVKIVLSGTAEPLVLKMEGRIVRSDSSGIGIAFESMDLDSYTHLKNIVRFNAENPDEFR